MGSIRLYGSTSGYLELQAPAVAPDATLTLPSDSVQPGLVLISEVDIGSSVSSITINNCFSDAYENYKITMSGGSGNNKSDGSFILGSTTTGYYNAFVYNGPAGATPTGVVVSNGSSTGTVWAYNIYGINLDMNVYSPYLTRRTGFDYTSVTYSSTGNRWNGNGFLDNNNSYNSITFQTQGGHLITGGTIRIYGYRNA